MENASSRPGPVTVAAAERDPAIGPGAVRNQPSTAQVGVWPVVLVLLTWLALLPRMLPATDSDRGIFVSVAGRLLDGDRLYVDVWDNKEPFFYYLTVPGRLLGPTADLLTEVACLLVVAGSVYAIAVRRADRRAALLLGFVLAPILFTGHNYYPGMTHLPALAVCLAGLACLLWRRWFVAGALMALLLYLKVVLLPVAGLLACWVLLVRRDRSALVRFSLGSALTAAAGALVLALRGELRPYADSLVVNVAYANGSLVGSGSPFLAHLARVFDLRTVVEVVVTLAIAGGVAVAWRRTPTRRRETLELLGCTVLSLAAAVLVLGRTGLWSHHAQILHIPAVLAASLLGPALGDRLRRASTVWATIRQVGLLGVLVVLLAGAQVPVALLDAWRDVPRVWALDTRTPPEARLLLTLGESGRYARLGQSDDKGHAAAVEDWDLACPRFAQYPFDPEPVLDEVYDCATRAPVLLISPTLAPEDGRPDWNTFVAEVEGVVAREYQCRRAEDIRVCTHR